MRRENPNNHILGGWACLCNIGDIPIHINGVARITELLPLSLERWLIGLGVGWWLIIT